MFALASILSLLTLVISVPIFLVFGLGSSIAAIGGLNLPWSVLIQVSFGALTKHVLIAVPLFIFSGMAMLKGGAALKTCKICNNISWTLARRAWCGNGYCDGFLCSILWIYISCNYCCWNNYDAQNDRARLPYSICCSACSICSIT